MESEDLLTNHEIGQRILSGELLVCPKISKCKVWQVFSKIMNQDGTELTEYAYCKGCKKVFKTFKQATSNLLKHKCYVLRFKNHDSSVDFDKPPIPITVVENSVNNLCKLLTKCIINDCRSYELVENKGLKLVYQEFLRLGSKFGCDMDVDRFLPKTEWIVQNVKNIYEKCFQTVKAKMAVIKENGFSLTANISTDNFSKQSYLALTIHYLRAGVLKYRLLGLRPMDCEKQSISQTCVAFTDV